VLKIKSWYFDVFAGACGIGIALGMVRFDFGILGRMMVDSGWITPAGIGDLAAINMTGYLLGCFHQSQLKNHPSVVKILMVSLLLINISLWLESIPFGFLSQAICRLICGWGAAHLVIALPGLALTKVPARMKRNCTAIIMSGGGIGALVAALAIGNLSNQAFWAWVVLSISATLFSVPVLMLLLGYRTRFNQNADLSFSGVQPTDSPQWRNLVLTVLVILGFVFMQVGQVPIVLYEPILAFKKLGLDAGMSSDSQSLFGLGLTLGAIITALVPRTIPTRLLLPLVSLFGLLGGVMFWQSSSEMIFFLSVCIVGFWDMSTGTLTYDRLGQFSQSHQHRHLWAMATMLGGIGFIIFSSSTAQLVDKHLNLILMVGSIVIAFQFIVEIFQIGFRGNQKMIAD
tara:strand:- start:922 stop:2121 length:1200 start_codon:yes stop_codon:yes gene_type:complete